MENSKMESSKMDESLNLKSENRNLSSDYAKLPQSILRFRISDLRSRICAIPNFSFSNFSLLICTLLIAATLTGAQRKQTFTGTITDNMCATADHSRMRMGSNDAECTIACVIAHGATYVLYD